MSFKQLQAEKDAADTTLRELTSLRTIQDVDALRAFLQDTHLKSEVCAFYLVDSKAQPYHRCRRRK